MGKGSKSRVACRRRFEVNKHRYQASTAELLSEVQEAMLAYNYNLDLEGYVALMKAAGVATGEYEPLAAAGPSAELRPILFKLLKQLDKE